MPSLAVDRRDLLVGDPAVHHDPDGVAGHEVHRQEDEKRDAEQHRQGVDQPLHDVAERYAWRGPGIARAPQALGASVYLSSQTCLSHHQPTVMLRQFFT